MKDNATRVKKTKQNRLRRSTPTQEPQPQIITREAGAVEKNLTLPQGESDRQSDGMDRGHPSTRADGRLEKSVCRY
jgi:hypothetical protein